MHCGVDAYMLPGPVLALATISCYACHHHSSHLNWHRHISSFASLFPHSLEHHQGDGNTAWVAAESDSSLLRPECVGHTVLQTNTARTQDSTCSSATCLPIRHQSPKSGLEGDPPHSFYFRKTAVPIVESVYDPQ